jgi:hypothetical protein
MEQIVLASKVSVKGKVIRKVIKYVIMRHSSIFSRIGRMRGWLDSPQSEVG